MELNSLKEARYTLEEGFPTLLHARHTCLPEAVHLSCKGVEGELLGGHAAAAIRIYVACHCLSCHGRIPQVLGVGNASGHSLPGSSAGPSSGFSSSGQAAQPQPGPIFNLEDWYVHINSRDPSWSPPKDLLMKQRAERLLKRRILVLQPAGDGSEVGSGRKHAVPLGDWIADFCRRYHGRSSSLVARPVQVLWWNDPAIGSAEPGGPSSQLQYGNWYGGTILSINSRTGHLTVRYEDLVEEEVAMGVNFIHFGNERPTGTEHARLPSPLPSQPPTLQPAAAGRCRRSALSGSGGIASGSSGSLPPGPSEGRRHLSSGGANGCSSSPGSTEAAPSTLTTEAGVRAQVQEPRIALVAKPSDSDVGVREGQDAARALKRTKMIAVVAPKMVADWGRAAAAAASVCGGTSVVDAEKGAAEASSSGAEQLHRVRSSGGGDGDGQCVATGMQMVMEGLPPQQSATRIGPSLECPEERPQPELEPRLQEGPMDLGEQEMQRQPFSGRPAPTEQYRLDAAPAEEPATASPVALVPFDTHVYGTAVALPLVTSTGGHLHEAVAEAPVSKSDSVAHIPLRLLPLSGSQLSTEISAVRGAAVAEPWPGSGAFASISCGAAGDGFEGGGSGLDSLPHQGFESFGHGWAGGGSGDPGGSLPRGMPPEVFPPPGLPALATHEWLAWWYVASSVGYGHQAAQVLVMAREAMIHCPAKFNTIVMECCRKLGCEPLHLRIVQVHYVQHAYVSLHRVTPEAGAKLASSLLRVIQLILCEATKEMQRHLSAAAATSTFTAPSAQAALPGDSGCGSGGAAGGTAGGVVRPEAATVPDAPLATSAQQQHRGSVQAAQQSQNVSDILLQLSERGLSIEEFWQVMAMCGTHCVQIIGIVTKLERAGRPIPKEVQDRLPSFVDLLRWAAAALPAGTAEARTGPDATAAGPSCPSQRGESLRPRLEVTMRRLLVHLRAGSNLRRLMNATTVPGAIQPQPQPEAQPQQQPLSAAQLEPEAQPYSAQPWRIRSRQLYALLKRAGSRWGPTVASGTESGSGSAESDSDSENMSAHADEPEPAAPGPGSGFPIADNGKVRQGILEVKHDHQQHQQQPDTSMGFAGPGDTACARAPMAFSPSTTQAHLATDTVMDVDPGGIRTIRDDGCVATGEAFAGGPEYPHPPSKSIGTDATGVATGAGHPGVDARLPAWGNPDVILETWRRIVYGNGDIDTAAFSVAETEPGGHPELAFEPAALGRSDAESQHVPTTLLTSSAAIAASASYEEAAATAATAAPPTTIITAPAAGPSSGRTEELRQGPELAGRSSAAADALLEVNPESLLHMDVSLLAEKVKALIARHFKQPRPCNVERETTSLADMAAAGGVWGGDGTTCANAEQATAASARPAHGGEEGTALAGEMLQASHHQDQGEVDDRQKLLEKVLAVWDGLPPQRKRTLCFVMRTLGTPPDIQGNWWAVEMVVRSLAALADAAGCRSHVNGGGDAASASPPGPAARSEGLCDSGSAM